MKVLVATSAVLLLTCLAAPARAQQSVTIEFHGGQVTLRAQNAPVRTILAEWARLGGSTVINGERIAGAPITLELTGVPERQALDIILRSAAGYMLAPRRAGSVGASAFDRILILPTSSAPRAPAAAPSAVRAPRPLLPQPQFVRPPAEPDDASGDDGDQGDQEEPVADPRPVPRIIGPPRVGAPPDPIGLEPETVEPDEDQEEPESPAQGVAPTPGNPFGVPFGSTSRPGVVTPVPQQQQPARPRRP